MYYNDGTMPVIASNLSSGLFEKIRGLVDKGLYMSPEQFLEIAAFNQVALEEGYTPEEIIERGHRGTGKTFRKSKSKPLRSKGRTRGRATRSKRDRTPVSEADLIEVLGRLAILESEVKGPLPASASIRPVGDRVWGQVNRLFPLKFACRWLAAWNTSRDSWDIYSAVSDHLSADAATVGSSLEQADEAARRKREELLGTGLSRRSNIASQDRFLSQFVARTTRSGDIYPGAICQYGFAEFDGDRLALTNRGLELALLRNPVLDDDLKRAATTLSDDERSYFVQQVLQFVPGELDDIRTVLKAIIAGNTTPPALMAAIRPTFPEDWSELVARTHVSGLVARLAEMALLQRHWEGRHVNYEPSATAASLL